MDLEWNHSFGESEADHGQPHAVELHDDLVVVGRDAIDPIS